MTSDNLRQGHEVPANEDVARPQKAPHNPKVAGSNPAPAIKKWPWEIEASERSEPWCLGARSLLFGFDGGATLRNSHR
jgi:hypothetical protein